MMHVIRSLRRLAEPVQDDFGSDYLLLVLPDSALTLQTLRRVKLRSVIVRRVEEASVALTLRHIFRRTTSKAAKAIREVTPEMHWFRSFPVDAGGV